MPKPALPRIDRESQQFEKPKENPSQQAASTVQIAEVKVELVTVTIPYASESVNGYQSKRCDLGLLTQEQARKLNAIRRGYDYSDGKMANGGSVKSLADAVKALLDSLEI